MATDDARHPVSAVARATDGDTDEFTGESPTLPIQFEPLAVTDERCRTGRAGMEELDAVSAAADSQLTSRRVATTQDGSSAKVS